MINVYRCHKDVINMRKEDELFRVLQRSSGLL